MHPENQDGRNGIRRDFVCALVIGLAAALVDLFLYRVLIGEMPQINMDAAWKAMAYIGVALAGMLASSRGKIRNAIIVAALMLALMVAMHLRNR